MEDVFLSSDAVRLSDSIPSVLLRGELTLLDSRKGFGVRSMLVVVFMDKFPSCCSQALHASSLMREAIRQPFSDGWRRPSLTLASRLERRKPEDPAPLFRMSGRLARDEEMPMLPAAGRSK
jgi:hypothetical protein